MTDCATLRSRSTWVGALLCAFRAAPGDPLRPGDGCMFHTDAGSSPPLLKEPSAPIHPRFAGLACLSVTDAGWRWNGRILGGWRYAGKADTG